MARSKVLRNIDVDESGDAGVTTPCVLMGYHAFNVSAGTRYLKLYDTAGAPTVGTDTPVMTIGIPTLKEATISSATGLTLFSKGIGVGATTGVADADTGAPGNNDVIVNLFWRTV